MLKHELKMTYAADLARRVEGDWNRCLDTANEYKGGQHTSDLLSNDIQKLQAHVDKDVDEGKYDLETAAHIKRYLSRAMQCCEQKKIQLRYAEQHKRGEAKGLEQTVGLLQKEYNAEKAKLENLQAAIEEAPGDEDPRKPKSIKQQRLAEKEKAATDAAPKKKKATKKSSRK